MTTATLPINEILRLLMSERRLRTTELARKVNLPQPTVQRIVKGNTTNPHPSSLRKLAEYFGISIAQLQGIEPISSLHTMGQNATPGIHKVPLFSWAKTSLEAKEQKRDEIVFTDAKIGTKAFALKMKDSSMEPLFPKDTVLIIDPDKEYKDRSYVLVSLQNYSEVIFRQLLVNGPDKYLKPLSPDINQYKISVLEENDRIIGVLAQAKKDFIE